MRVIFSRKGFDSSSGGCASPIVSGRPVSLPIPTRMPSPICFTDLGPSIGSMVNDLTGGRVSADRSCHLDPDVDAASLPSRPSGWRGCLGQVGAAQAHLDRQGVGVGDLFLFWGLFRAAERHDDSGWRFVGPPEHRIFGWLQVGDVLRVGPQGSAALSAHPWLRDHPHARDGWSEYNTLYVASEMLRLSERELRIPGWGVFSHGYRLTANGRSPSIWSVPAWLDPNRGGSGMSYHGRADRWQSAAGLLSCAARGQEFVADIGTRPDALAWLAALWVDGQP